MHDVSQLSKYFDGISFVIVTEIFAEEYIC